MSDEKRRVVLVVDDEAFARLFAVQIFMDEGWIVLEAGDADEALDVLDNNDDISLVFTDISMPGDMDGLGLARAVRALRKDIALLVTSGRMEPVDRQIPSGGRFLPKPYTAYSLLDTIRGMPSPSAGC